MKNVAKLSAKSENFKSIRIKEKTKSNATDFLKKINAAKLSNKITFDILINFLLDDVTEHDIENLQISALTWEIESQRIRALFENDFGTVTDDFWIQFIQTDDYRTFASKHSRLPLPWEQPPVLPHK